jgi:hypothetical protein
MSTLSCLVNLIFVGPLRTRALEVCNRQRQRAKYGREVLRCASYEANDNEWKAYLIRLAREVVVALHGTRNSSIQVREAGVISAVDRKAIARAVLQLQVQLAVLTAVGDGCLGTDGRRELFAVVCDALTGELRMHEPSRELQKSQKEMV